ncbi:MAG: hypothetical protein IJ415_02110 [Clostridia bacterium]|nr:hypothetical protein [Clostridia bacterium]
MKKQNDFEFKYVAPTSEERKEIESIRNSYIQKSDTKLKLERLRKLDFRVKNVPMIVALSIGIIGVLLFGLGLTMILEWSLTILGIMIGVLSLVPIAIAHPVHIILSKKIREKYSAEILKLSDELLKD